MLRCPLDYARYCYEKYLPSPRYLSIDEKRCFVQFDATRKERGRSSFASAGSVNKLRSFDTSLASCRKCFRKRKRRVSDEFTCFLQWWMFYARGVLVSTSFNGAVLMLACCQSHATLAVCCVARRIWREQCVVGNSRKCCHITAAVLTPCQFLGVVYTYPAADIWLDSEGGPEYVTSKICTWSVCVWQIDTWYSLFVVVVHGILLRVYKQQCTYLESRC